MSKLGQSLCCDPNCRFCYPELKDTVTVTETKNEVGAVEVNVLNRKSKPVQYSPEFLENMRKNLGKNREILSQGDFRPGG